MGLTVAMISGDRAPSSELRMHLGIAGRTCAPWHARPPAVTGVAVGGEFFVAPVLPEVILQMGAVLLVSYASPGTDALAALCESTGRAGHDPFLMANHGATTVGHTLGIALQRMESLEHAVRIMPCGSYWPRGS